MERLAMSEVEPEELKNVLGELKHLLNSGRIGDEKAMKVFDLTELDAFVRDTADAFCRDMEVFLHR